MPTRDDIERSATVLIRLHGGHERAAEWAENRAYELLAVPDREGAEVMFWIARTIMRRVESPDDADARRRYRGDI